MAAYTIYCANNDGKDVMKSVTELDLHGYCIMNILDYLIGSTDRHWKNRGVMVDNETNKPIRLYDLMDFNQAFNSYNRHGRCQLSDRKGTESA